MPLNVSGAFHSYYMDSISKQFENFLQKFTFKPPSIPIIANINAKEKEEDKIKYNLSKQISTPVYWKQSIKYLLAKEQENFEEIGIGNILTGLVNRIRHEKNDD